MSPVLIWQEYRYFHTPAEGQCWQWFADATPSHRQCRTASEFSEWVSCHALPWCFVFYFSLQIGPFGLLLMGVIATHCMLQLVACAKELCRKCVQYNYPLSFPRASLPGVGLAPRDYSFPDLHLLICLPTFSNMFAGEHECIQSRKVFLHWERGCCISRWFLWCLFLFALDSFSGSRLRHWIILKSLDTLCSSTLPTHRCGGRWPGECEATHSSTSPFHCFFLLFNYAPPVMYSRAITDIVWPNLKDIVWPNLLVSLYIIETESADSLRYIVLHLHSMFVSL